MAEEILLLDSGDTHLNINSFFIKIDKTKIIPDELIKLCRENLRRKNKLNEE